MIGEGEITIVMMTIMMMVGDYYDIEVDRRLKVCVECSSHVVEKNFERRRRWRCCSCNLLDGGRKEPKKAFV